MIANQENYDSISKLNSLAKEIKDYVKSNDADVSNFLQKDSKMFNWLEESIDELLS